MAKSSNNLPTIEQLSGADRELIDTGLRRGATRREVMSWLVASGVTIAAAGSIVSSAKIALAATPKKGGKLRFAADAHGPADTLDPSLNTGIIDYSRGRSIYNGLCQINDDLSTRPELAEEYSANSDNSEWTFKLRKVRGFEPPRAEFLQAFGRCCDWPMVPRPGRQSSLSA